MKRIILHIDVNNAFLSWTAVDLLKSGHKKDIRCVPSVIGGDETKRTGIVLAKSPEAKKHGIVTGETLYSARKKYNNLEIYPSNYELYERESNKFIEIIKKYTPDIEQVSIDECFIDYTKVKSMYGCELSFAKKLQSEIYSTLGFTVNIGIANNKLCAKMASDFSKPNKIHTLYDDEVKIKMWPLDVGELYGIGKKSASVLHELKIHTIGDLASSDINFLYKYFKNITASLIDKANGIDTEEVDSSEYIPKGIGNEITIDHDVYEKEELHKYLLALSENVGLRIRKMNKYASVVVLTLKNNKFRRMNHQKKLKNSINDTDSIYKVSKELLKETDIIDPIRLIGIRLDMLEETSDYQLSLFDSHTNSKENRKLDKTVDNLKNKFGSSIIKKASLMDESIPSPHKK